jgi:hypothetical protein
MGYQSGVYRKQGGDDLVIASSGAITMESGSKTINHGQLIAVSWKLTARAGSDSVAITAGGYTGTVGGRPHGVSDLGAGFVARALPIVAFNFNGTWATLAGVPTYQSRSSTTFQSGSTPDERGAFFKLPFACKVAGLLVRNAYGASSTTYKLQIYSDPAGTPAVISGASKTVDTDTLVSASTADVLILFDAPVALAANTRYVAAMQPQDSTACGISTLAYASTGTAGLHMAGANWTYATRSDNTGAFSETTTTKWIAQLLISDIADGAAPTYCAGVM